MAAVGPWGLPSPAIAANITAEVGEAPYEPPNFPELLQSLRFINFLNLIDLSFSSLQERRFEFRGNSYTVVNSKVKHWVTLPVEAT